MGNTKTLQSTSDLRSRSCQTTQKLYNQKDIQPLKERYQDVDKNEIEFLWKVWVDTEYNGETTKLPILITQRNDITPLLGVNWLKQSANYHQHINKVPFRRIHQQIKHHPHKIPQTD